MRQGTVKEWIEKLQETRKMQQEPMRDRDETHTRMRQHNIQKWATNYDRMIDETIQEWGKNLYRNERRDEKLYKYRSKDHAKMR